MGVCIGGEVLVCVSVRGRSNAGCEPVVRKIVAYACVVEKECGYREGNGANPSAAAIGPLLRQEASGGQTPDDEWAGGS